jgi:glycosyltransferase involved in cell wall biosynthesis
MLTGRKILFVSEYAGFFGGVERYIFAAAKLLREAGAEVWGCFAAESRDVELFRTAFDRIVSDLRDLPGDFDLATLHKTRDNRLIAALTARFPDRLALFVHDHDFYCPRKYKYLPWRRLNCHFRYRRLPCAVCGMLTSPRSWPDGAAAELGEKWFDFPARIELLRRMPATAVLSKFMRENLIQNGFPPEKICMVPPFVPLPPPGEPPRNEAPELLFVGQLIRGKGADLFLDLLARLRSPFHARIVGDGNDRPMLEGRCRELGLADHVRFTGWSATPEAFFQAADLAVFPFRWQEPFGLVLAESASYGLPVVAFDIGGAAESILHGETGYLAEPGDVAGLAAYVEELLNDPEKRRAFGARGRQLVGEKFSADSFIKGFENLMEHLGR